MGVDTALALELRPAVQPVWRECDAFYWANFEGGSVIRADKRGNLGDHLRPLTESFLRRDWKNPWELVLGDQFVYVTVQGDGTVLALNKKRGPAMAGMSSAIFSTKTGKKIRDLPPGLQFPSYSAEEGSRGSPAALRTSPARRSGRPSSGT